MEELKKFLSKCGHDKKVIDQLIGFSELSEEEQKEVDIDVYADGFKNGQREVFKSDPDFINDLRTDSDGKARGSVERVILREFGINAEEVRENELTGDYNKILKFAKSKVEKTNKKTAQETQDELRIANEKIKDYDENLIPKIRAESKKEIGTFYVQNRVNDLIAECGKLYCKSNTAAEILTTKLNKKYQVSYDEEKKDISILTGDGLKPLNADKTLNMSNAEIVKSMLIDEGLLVQSKAPDEPGESPVPPTPPPPTPPPAKQKFRPQGMDKAEESVKQEIRVVK